MSSDEPAFVDVAAEAEVGPSQVVPIRVGRRDLLLCNVDGTLFAIADRCTHAAWTLADGELRNGEIICSLHGATFDVRTGRATGAPATKALGTFPVRTQNGRILVQVHQPPR